VQARRSETDGGPRTLGLRPGAPVRGRFRPPGSKSLAQRAIVIAALAEGSTRILGLSQAEDVDAALALAAACGPRVERPAPGEARIEGLPPARGGWVARGTLQLGESGTLARLATAVLGLCGSPGSRARLDPAGSLARRESAPLFRALVGAGVGLEHLGTAGGWPAVLTAAFPREELLLVSPVSSQEVSALLIALSAHGGRTELEVRSRIPSRPYADMTVRLLGRFGVRVDSCAWVRGGQDEEDFALYGPCRAPASPVEIEPDASAAAVALCAACLSGGELRVEGLGPGSLQGDVRIAEHLRAFGCDAALDAGGLRAGGRPSHGARVDLSGEPDLAPPLAAVAAAAAQTKDGAEGESVLSGLGTLYGKESPRLEVLARGLREVGFEARASGDSLHVGRALTRAPEGLRLDPAGDHRMAFAFALLGLLRPGVDVLDPGCVSKSWPSFWGDLERLGARVVRS
jgi:3-phosphoshikimate 1-carboxyvinyltransferase